MTSGDVAAAQTKAAIDAAVGRVRPASEFWRQQGEHRLDRLTKPPGSLGRLEEVALQCCAIQETLNLTTVPRRIIVCAADHGVVAEGVSAYPKASPHRWWPTSSAVARRSTPLPLPRMRTCGSWTSASTVRLPRAAGMHASSRAGCGTARNILDEPAMTEAEVLAALQVGLDLAAEAVADGVRLLGLGEMGIGNTTAASAVTAGVTGRPAAAVTGRGTGVDEETFARKISTVGQAIARHGCTPGAPLEVLRAVGGLEIAALCGICLGAADRKIAIVADGFVATSAALVAAALAPSLTDYLFAGHLSPEPGHAIQLEHLGLPPLLNLQMRLGEGTGAALAMPVIGAAARAFTSMATFESAGVSEPEP